MKYSLFCLVFLWAYSSYSQSPIIKISKNEFERQHKILFSAQESYNIKVSLLGNDKSQLMSEKFQQQQFVKAYDLGSLAEGNYFWEIAYGKEKHTEAFEIKSLKKLMKESISVVVEDYQMDILVAEFNNLPMNIFLFNAYGDQIDYVFWEPSSDERQKRISLHSYDAYEIKVEILQNGDIAYKKEYALY